MEMSLQIGTSFIAHLLSNHNRTFDIDGRMRNPCDSGWGWVKAWLGPGEVGFTLGVSPNPTLWVEGAFETTEFGTNIGRGHITGLVGLVVSQPISLFSN